MLTVHFRRASERRRILSCTTQRHHQLPALLATAALPPLLQMLRKMLSRETHSACSVFTLDCRDCGGTARMCSDTCNDISTRRVTIALSLSLSLSDLAASYRPPPCTGASHPTRPKLVPCTASNISDGLDTIQLRSQLRSCLQRQLTL